MHQHARSYDARTSGLLHTHTLPASAIRFNVFIIINGTVGAGCCNLMCLGSWLFWK
jgi:hypothetical protein